MSEAIEAAFDEAITELAPVVGVKDACAAVGRPRATHYRRHRQSPAPARAAREPRPQPRALTAAERDEVLDVLHEERFVDLSPGEVYAILLDGGRYLCSESTMYRLLRAQHGAVRERRRQATHPPRAIGDLAQPHRVQPVGLRAAREVLDVLGVDQPRLELGRLEDVEDRFQ